MPIDYLHSSVVVCKISYARDFPVQRCVGEERGEERCSIRPLILINSSAANIPRQVTPASKFNEPERKRRGAGGEGAWRREARASERVAEIQAWNRTSFGAESAGISIDSTSSHRVEQTETASGQSCAIDPSPPRLYRDGFATLGRSERRGSERVSARYRSAFTLNPVAA